MSGVYHYSAVKQLVVINADTPEGLLASPQGSCCAIGEAMPHHSSAPLAVWMEVHLSGSSRCPSFLLPVTWTMHGKWKKEGWATGRPKTLHVSRSKPVECMTYRMLLHSHIFLFLQPVISPPSCVSHSQYSLYLALHNSRSFH